jgi:uncharacterized OB-fold protein
VLELPAHTEHLKDDILAEQQNNNNLENPGPLQTFEENLAKGEFRIQQCKDCGQHVFYPRLLCHHCGSNALKWVAVSGKGVVYSSAVVRQRPEKGGDYNISLIDLEEGPRLMSRVVDVDPEEVAIGMQVSAHVGMINDKPAVLFYNKEQGDKEW